MNLILNGTISQGDREQVTITNPANGQAVDVIHKAREGDQGAILEVAEQGYREWSKTPLSKRAEILMRYADLLDQNRERIALLECREMGKIITECTGEATVASLLTRGFVERAKHLYGKTFCDNQPGLEQDLIFTRREPLGVFLCIVPFNYPVELYTHKVIPALIMGNSVIIKVPAHNPLAMVEMTKLLLEAGVPQSAATVVYCDRQFCTDKIIKSPRIQAVSLTGSTAAGVAVFRDSAEHLHKVFLELGGNDPLIVFEDADLDETVEQILGGRVSNTGQTCCASKRFLVHQSVQDALVEKLTARLDKIKRGDPADPATGIGCIVSRGNADCVLRDIQHTVAQGARCVYGGTVKDGTFVEPTVLVDVTREMDVAGDLEIFGPVMPIITFETEEEAVEIANQTPYGLQAGIMSGDTLRALQVASRLQAGSVVVNGTGNYRHMDMPFGGYKMTGIGREGVCATLEEYSQEKSYVVKNAIR